MKGTQTNFLYPEYLLRGCYFTYEEKFKPVGITTYKQFIDYLVEHVEGLFSSGEPLTINTQKTILKGHSKNKLPSSVSDLDQTCASSASAEHCNESNRNLNSEDGCQMPLKTDQDNRLNTIDIDDEEILLPNVPVGYDQVSNHRNRQPNNKHSSLSRKSIYPDRNENVSLMVDNNSAKEDTSNDLSGNTDDIIDSSIFDDNVLSPSSQSTIPCIADNDMDFTDSYDEESVCLVDVEEVQVESLLSVKYERDNDEFTLKLETSHDPHQIEDVKPSDSYVIRPSQESPIEPARTIYESQLHNPSRDECFSPPLLVSTKQYVPEKDSISTSYSHGKQRRSNEKVILYPRETSSIECLREYSSCTTESSIMNDRMSASEESISTNFDSSEKIQNNSLLTNNTGQTKQVGDARNENPFGDVRNENLTDDPKNSDKEAVSSRNNEDDTNTGECSLEDGSPLHKKKDIDNEAHRTVEEIDVRHDSSPQSDNGDSVTESTIVIAHQEKVMTNSNDESININSNDKESIHEKDFGASTMKDLQGSIDNIGIEEGSDSVVSSQPVRNENDLSQMNFDESNTVSDILNEESTNSIQRQSSPIVVERVDIENENDISMNDIIPTNVTNLPCETDEIQNHAGSGINMSDIRTKLNEPTEISNGLSAPSVDIFSRNLFATMRYTLEIDRKPPDVKSPNRDLVKENIRDSVVPLRRLGFDVPGGSYRVCEVCNRIFRSSRDLRLHKGTHVEVNGKRPFACDICPRSYSSQQSLVSHKRLLHDGANKLFSCSISGCSFTGESSLRIKRHERAVHKIDNGNLRLYSCGFCERQFTYKQSKDLHERSHTGERPFKCTFCEKTFFDQGTLRRHIKRLHTNERPFHCYICSKHFTYSSDLRRHLDSHAGIRPFSCSICPLRFTQKAHLQTHLKSIHSIFIKKAELV